jgi:hypothetical protein
MSWKLRGVLWDTIAGRFDRDSSSFFQQMHYASAFWTIRSDQMILETPHLAFSHWSASPRYLSILCKKVVSRQIGHRGAICPGPVLSNWFDILKDLEQKPSIEYINKPNPSEHRQSIAQTKFFPTHSRRSIHISRRARRISTSAHGQHSCTSHRIKWSIELTYSTRCQNNPQVFSGRWRTRVVLERSHLTY